MEKAKLFELIKEKIPKNISFIDEIADVLDISYDASYRRIKGKTVLTLKEGLSLSSYFNINLNDVSVDRKNHPEKIIVEKSHNLVSDNFLHTFFDKSKEEITKIISSKNGQIYNCVKDFPFYHADNGSLKKFRIYLFINMLSKDPNLKKIPFSKFEPSYDIIEKYNFFLKQYGNVSLVEIWNDSTIDNIINQIQYFFDVGLTTKEEALSIADGLIDSLKLIEEQAKNNKRIESKESFHLYQNNLISLLNTIFMKSDTEKKVFVPFTNLTYFKVIDKNTTNQIEQHLKTQLEFSTNLTGESSVERNKFFNSMYQKIEKRKLKLNF
ncbi:MAG: hypothetical protein V3V28_08900 [Polaribacter sp.]|uniref:hypothetical protein n=1 Tax=Polaribacter sp. TaxID=1920175 RepID=UPI002F35311E